MEVRQVKLLLLTPSVRSHRQDRCCMVPLVGLLLLCHPVEFTPCERLWIYADDSCKLVDVSFNEVDSEFNKSIKF